MKKYISYFGFFTLISLMSRAIVGTIFKGDKEQDGGKVDAKSK